MFMVNNLFPTVLQAIYINNSLHWAQKYGRIFVRGHYLFREANSFPRAKLEEKCELRGRLLEAIVFSILKSFSQRVRFWKLGNMYGLLTKCEVKMAGYWPSSLFPCLWTETKSRSINSQKKRTRPISSHLDRTNLANKGFIIWLLGKFCLRDTAGSPERARWPHLARSGSQSQLAIWFILHARGTSHITINNYSMSARWIWHDRKPTRRVAPSWL